MPHEERSLEVHAGQLSRADSDPGGTVLLNNIYTVEHGIKSDLFHYNNLHIYTNTQFLISYLQIYRDDVLEVAVSLNMEDCFKIGEMFFS